MLNPLDRNFFPKNLGVLRPTAKGYARYMSQYVPETGPFRRVSIIEFLDSEVNPRLRRQIERFKMTKAERTAQYIARCRDAVAHSGWRMKVQWAAQIALDVIAEKGLRFELKCVDLARALGLSESMGSYYLKRLREVGFLDRYRDHYIDWDRTDELRDATDDESAFFSRPAVHELNNPRSEALLHCHPPELKDSYTDEKVPLTCENFENPQVRA